MYNLNINELTPGRKYHVKVRAKADDLDYSEWSPIFSFETSQDTTPPGLVENLTFISEGDSFIAKWDAPSINEDGTKCTDLFNYNLKIRDVYRNITVTAQTSTPAFNIDFNKNVQLFGSPSGKIEISVAGVDQVGNIGKYASAIAQNPPPEQVKNVKASSTVEAINITWDHNSDTDLVNYGIYVSENSGFETNEQTFICSVAAGTNTYTLPSSAFNGIYIKVLAFDKFNQRSIDSEEIFARPNLTTDFDKTPPAVVQGFQVSQRLAPDNKTAEAVITYTSNTELDLDKYEVQYRKTGDSVSPWTFVIIPSDQSSSIVRNLNLNTDYDFKIRAVDFNANKGLWTDVIRAEGVKKISLPPAPTSVTVDGGMTNLMISWNESVDVTMRDYSGMYEVEISESQDFTNPISKKVNGTLVSFMNQKADTTFYVRVRAIDQFGNIGPWSDVVEGGTGNASDPDAPRLTWAETAPDKAKNGDTWIKLPENVMHYFDGTKWVKAQDTEIIDHASGNKTTYSPTEPAVAKEDDVWFDDANNVIKIYKNGQWVDISDSITTTESRLALKTADGKNTVYYATPPAGAVIKNGDTWFDSSSGNTVIKVYKDGNWTNISDSIQTTAATTALTAANGKNKNIYSVNVASGTTGYTNGDTWFQKDSTGQIIGLWEFSGNQWIKKTLTDSVITNLNAGTITAGTLSADRIAANSIMSDKLVIGRAGNLIANGDLSQGLYPWDTAFTLITGTSNTTPNGRYLTTVAGQGTIGSTQVVQDWIDVAPDAYYAFEIWMSADKVGSNISIELRNQDGAHAGSSGGDVVNTGDISTGSGAYLLGNTPVQTGWNRYSCIYRMSSTTTKIRLGAFYFNHSQGSVTDAKISFGGISLRPMSDSTLIQNGAITTNKIVAGAVTSNEIAANAIDATKIKSNSIRSKHLVVSPDNLVENPGFLNNGQGWSSTATATVKYVSTSDARGYAEVTPSATQDCIMNNTADSKFSITGGTTYRTSMTVTSASVIPASNLHCGIYFYDVNGIYISNSGLYWTTSIDANKKQTVYAHIKAPDNAAQAVIRLWFKAGLQKVTVENPTLVEAVGSTLITDGAVTTEKLFAEAVTADKIKAGSITVGGNKSPIDSASFNASAKNAVNTDATAQMATFRNVTQFSSDDGNGSSTINNMLIYAPITSPSGKSYMTTMDISGYSHYGAATNLDLTVSFYAYGGSNFSQCAAVSRGSLKVGSITIYRDTQNSNKIVLAITIASPMKWACPKVTVDKVTVGYSSPDATWGDQSKWSMNWLADTDAEMTRLNSLTGGNKVVITPTNHDDTVKAAENWRDVRNTTQINGGNIYTDTIDARSINVDSFKAKTIHGDSITAETMNGNRIITDSLDAKVLSTNSAFMSDLLVKSKFQVEPGGVIQSTNFNDTAKTGYWLDNQKLIINQGRVEAAAIMLQDSSNVMPAAYAAFNYSENFYSRMQKSNITTLIIKSGGKFGKNYLNLRVLTSSAWIRFTQGSATEYNIPLEAGQKYIISYYAKATTGNVRIRPVLYYDNAGTAASMTINYQSVAKGTAWNRYSYVFTAPNASNGVNHLVFYVYDAAPATGSYWNVDIDGIQIEQQTSQDTSPSPWSPPGYTAIEGEAITTGSISSNQDYTFGGQSIAKWSIDLYGNATFADAMIAGKLTVGGSASPINNKDISIQSSTYSSGNSGWAIFGDGNVEFNDGKFRGMLELGKVVNQSNTEIPLKMFIGIASSDGQGTSYTGTAAGMLRSNVGVNQITDVPAAAITGTTYGYKRIPNGSYYKFDNIANTDKISRYYIGPTTERNITTTVIDNDMSRRDIYQGDLTNNIVVSRLKIGETIRPTQSPILTEDRGLDFYSGRIDVFGDHSGYSAYNNNYVNLKSVVSLRSPGMPESREEENILDYDTNYTSSAHTLEAQAGYGTSSAKNIINGGYLWDTCKFPEHTSPTSNQLLHSILVAGIWSSEAAITEDGSYMSPSVVVGYTSASMSFSPRFEATLTGGVTYVISFYVSTAISQTTRSFFSSFEHSSSPPYFIDSKHNPTAIRIAVRNNDNNAYGDYWTATSLSGGNWWDVPAGTKTARVSFSYTPATTMAAKSMFIYVSNPGNSGLKGVTFSKFQIEAMKHNNNIVPPNIRSIVAPTPWQPASTATRSRVNTKLSVVANADADQEHYYYASFIKSPNRFSDLYSMNSGEDFNRRKIVGGLRLDIDESSPLGELFNASYTFTSSGMVYPGGTTPFLPVAGTIEIFLNDTNGNTSQNFYWSEGNSMNLLPQYLYDDTTVDKTASRFWGRLVKSKTNISLKKPAGNPENRHGVLIGQTSADASVIYVQTPGFYSLQFTSYSNIKSTSTSNVMRLKVSTQDPRGTNASILYRPVTPNMVTYNASGMSGSGVVYLYGRTEIKYDANFQGSGNYYATLDIVRVA